MKPITQHSHNIYIYKKAYVLGYLMSEYVPRMVHQLLCCCGTCETRDGTPRYNLRPNLLGLNQPFPCTALFDNRIKSVSSAMLHRNECFMRDGEYLVGGEAGQEDCAAWKR